MLAFPSDLGLRGDTKAKPGRLTGVGHGVVSPRVPVVSEVQVNQEYTLTANGQTLNWPRVVPSSFYNYIFMNSRFTCVKIHLEMAHEHLQFGIPVSAPVYQTLD